MSLTIVHGPRNYPAPPDLLPGGRAIFGVNPTQDHFEGRLERVRGQVNGVTVIDYRFNRREWPGTANSTNADPSYSPRSTGYVNASLRE